MRQRSFNNGVSVHAIAGTHTVMLGLDAERHALDGLLGFAIQRTDFSEDEQYWLCGFKAFEETDPDAAPGTLKSTLEHPVQSFLWGDYTAKPAHDYAYRIRPVYGRPKRLTYGDDVVVRVSTEDEDDGEHAIYFNRGAIASQAFSRKFGHIPKAEIPTHPDSLQWLSRGLLEAAVDFIAQAKGPKYTLHVAAYEFTYEPILQALKDAVKRKAQVRIIFEDGTTKVKGRLVLTSATKSNRNAIRRLKLVSRTISRTNRKAIPHNKFIVLLENGHPIQVWTGSTNFSQSGFLGQTNVGHVVRDEAVAASFEAYWQMLRKDPVSDDLRAWTTAHSPRPVDELDPGTRAFYSPRPRSTMLDWYAERLGQARQTVMFTAAFGVNKKLAGQFAVDKEYLRFILCEKQPAQSQLEALRTDPDTLIAWGAAMGGNALNSKVPGWRLDDWYATEEHYRNRSQGHVFYVHTKFLLIDPLSDDPQIYSGSANFSDASLLNNDENMLLIRGNTRVADVYAGEFTRIFNHFYARNHANRIATASPDSRGAVYLKSTDAWTQDFFKPTKLRCKRRELFA